MVATIIYLCLYSRLVWFRVQCYPCMHCMLVLVLYTCIHVLEISLFILIMCVLSEL